MFNLNFNYITIKKIIKMDVHEKFIIVDWIIAVISDCDARYSSGGLL